MGNFFIPQIESSSSYINHFLQPDTIIPNLSDPQSWNRFSYAMNNPIKYSDPTGHSVACESGDGNGCTKDKGYSKLDNLKYKITKNYAINLRGKWNVEELANLNAALDKLVLAVGGISNLNVALARAADTRIHGTTTIDIERVAQPRWNPDSIKPSAAAWCGKEIEETCTPGTIVFADDTFSAAYQFHSSNYKRSSFTSDLNVAIQFTMTHEFAHALTTANPIALNAYVTVWGGTKESMANELALQTVAGESQFGAWAFSYGFWNYSCTSDCKMVK